MTVRGGSPPGATGGWSASASQCAARRVPAPAADAVPSRRCVPRTCSSTRALTTRATSRRAVFRPPGGPPESLSPGDAVAVLPTCRAVRARGCRPAMRPRGWRFLRPSRGGRAERVCRGPRVARRPPGGGRRFTRGYKPPPLRGGAARGRRGSCDLALVFASVASFVSERLSVCRFPLRPQRPLR